MATVSHRLEFDLEQPVGDVFPLFTPEGEKLWAPGWDYENVMGSEKLHEDYVFQTRTHDHAAADAIWIVKKFDPENHLVQYYKVEPRSKVGVVTVRCERLAAHRTRVAVGYAYTGLSEEGNAFIDGFTPAVYRNFIGEWKSLIESYFGKRRRT